jgi:GH15 family glucan-1,4-alpha-glucosidase
VAQPKPVDRTDGFLGLRDYAVIGDGRTAALVGRDAAVDWLTLPDLDSPTVFAAVLDPERGGCFILQPQAPFGACRRYLPDTNVLETTFVTDTGTVRVTDALTLNDDTVLCPMRELQRRIDAVSGSVAMRWVVQPRFGYGKRPRRISWRSGFPIVSQGSSAMAVCSFGAGQPDVQDGQVAGEFTASEHDSARLVVTFADQEPLVFPSRTDCDDRMSHTVAAWREWATRCCVPDSWRDALLRSALAIKLLVFAPSGAIAAAATSSLPEQIGGERNWDYRFSWIRDSVFTVDAFLRLGCIGEAHSYFWWLMHASQRTLPRLGTLYRLDGGASRRERTLSLAGYRRSRPVRVGNAAADQTQLDSYGELLQTSSLYIDAVGGLDTDAARRLARLADFVCATWQHMDAGIWEVRSQQRHFTHSKMMCWVALDRAVGLAERGLIPHRRLARWRSSQDQIRKFVESQCVSSRRGCYVRHADSNDLDAATLLGLLQGYSDPADPYMPATVEAVNTELRSGPYVQRYQGDDGLQGSEGAFLACSFWLAEALARIGRVDEAAALMDELIECANDVGLYSEEVDPDSGVFLGNLPQALTHLALINAAQTIAAQNHGTKQ